MDHIINLERRISSLEHKLKLLELLILKEEQIKELMRKRELDQHYADFNDAEREGINV